MVKRFLIAITAMIFICGVGVAQDSPNVELRAIELIIKAAPETIVMPEGHYRAEIEDIIINSEDLKELNKRFNLISIERMFAKKIDEEEAEEEDADKKLKDVYLLKFPEHTDINVLIEEYKNADGIIYAEENKEIEIF